MNFALQMPTLTRKYEHVVIILRKEEVDVKLFIDANFNINRKQIWIPLRRHTSIIFNELPFQYVHSERKAQIFCLTGQICLTVDSHTHFDAFLLNVLPEKW